MTSYTCRLLNIRRRMVQRTRSIDCSQELRLPVRSACCRVRELLPRYGYQAFIAPAFVSETLLGFSWAANHFRGPPALVMALCKVGVYP